jgi:hypothetical protein
MPVLNLPGELGPGITSLLLDGVPDFCGIVLGALARHPDPALELPLRR